MKIPDIATCAALMEQHKMLANIREHSLVVARIAGLLAEKLHQQGVPAPNLQLCISGALLHDIAKTPCLETGCDHAKTGAAICHDLGLPDIAEIVAGHVVLRDFNPTRYQKGIFSAHEIVYYADKRVLHDKIVHLSERLAYILEKYGHGKQEREERIRANFAQCKQLENDIFSFLPCAPEELLNLVLPYRLSLPSTW
jgi:putative nucleotidyltransferase with HDIG domain